jgi:polyisoprenoid-binding protein YceI
MKSIKWIIAFAISSSLVLMSCTGEGVKKKETDKASKKEVAIQDQNFNIDTDKSKVQWKGTLVGVYDHSGTLNFKSGSIKIEDGKIKSGSFVVDMATMVATDENYNPEKGSTKEKLIGHLSSPDFFDTENYPTAEFVIKEHKEGTIKGDLTIRGKTNLETVENVEIKKDGDKLTFIGDLTFDRQKYDVAWAHPMKDKVLKDDIELKIILK